MTSVPFESILQTLGVLVVSAPAVLLAVLGLSVLTGVRLSEQVSGRLTQAAVIVGLIANLAILGLMLATDLRKVPIEIGDWVALPQEHFFFHLKFVFDRLSVPFALLSFILCGAVGAFTSVYLHRERGYPRFFLLYSVFLLGMIVSALAGTIETLFFGWELVGLSSALLVAFFHERPGPVRNGHRVWAVYRIADAAFLVAALTLHHLTGGGDFDGLMGAEAWPEGRAGITAGQALLVGSLLLIAAAGKSGMIPFSGWLPRAMEGPTPSSAVFYGALSVHLGAYLLLRVSPVLEVSLVLRILVVLLGLASAVAGALAARVQTDAKCALAFASLTQVGIIVVEIGCGFRYLALIHIIGHASMRTLQLLRAPSQLLDHHQLQDAMGAAPPQPEFGWSDMLSRRWSEWLYRFAMERAYLDSMINEWLVAPFVKTFCWCDRMERRWTTWLAGPEPAAEPNASPADAVEELA